MDEDKFGLRKPQQLYLKSAAAPFSKNEVFWIEVIRQATSDADPAPTLSLVRNLRRVFRGAGEPALQDRGVGEAK